MNQQTLAARTAIRYPEALTSPRWGAGVCVGLGSFVFLFAFGLFVWRGRRRTGVPDAPGSAPAAPAPSTGPFEVRRLSFAFDWTQRAMIQSHLEQMAGQYDMNTAAGMHRAASQARDLLLSCVQAAQYATFQRYHLDGPGAEGQLARMTNDLRARFSEETVNQAYRQQYGQLRPRREEGEGLVVVSMLVGSMHHLPELPGQLNRPAVQHALQTALPGSPDDLVALEVIWSPSDDADRMSSAELEMFYPELQRLDDAGQIGRIACAYCRAPFPAELGRCPGCGAPVG